MAIWKSTIKPKTMMLFCRQFGTMYQAGVPVVRTLETLQQQRIDPHLRRVLRDVLERLRAGDTLGDAIEENRSHFPAFFVELIKVGERGGKLDEILRSLAYYFERRVVMMRDFKSRLVLPALELMVGFPIAVFALTVISNIDFEQGRTDWTAISNDFMLYMGASVAAVVGIVLLVWVLRHISAGAYMMSQFNLALPVVRSVIIKFDLSRFTRSLALLLESGMPAPTAWELAANTARNAVIRKRLRRGASMLTAGATFYEAALATRIIDPMTREMIHTGEEVGELSQMMHRVATTYEEEAEAALSALAKATAMLIYLCLLAIGGYAVIKFWMMYFSKLTSVF